VKVDANRRAINALGVQTAARFDRVDERFDRLEAEVRTGFAEVRGRLDGAAAGYQHIVELLTTLLRDDQR
jgi:nitrate reductase assembly molybdenum cofactor insertion protein NarJ